MAWTPSVAGAPTGAALASCISSATFCQAPLRVSSGRLLDPLLFLGLLLAPLLLELALTLLLLLLLREEDVLHGDVDLGPPKAHQALYPVGDVAPDGLGQLRDGLAVLGRERQVERGLLLANLHGDAL